MKSWLFYCHVHFFHLEVTFFTWRLSHSSILLIGETEPAALSFNGQSDAKEDQDQGAGKESNWEGTSNQLPSDGGKDGSDDSTKESQVEGLLHSVDSHQSPQDWANYAFNTAAISFIYALMPRCGHLYHYCQTEGTHVFIPQTAQPNKSNVHSCATSARSLC